MKSLGKRSWIGNLIQTRSSRAKPKKTGPNFYRLRLEPLEDRVVPTTWTVTNTLASGAGSLFAAVQSANSDTSPAIINFSPTVFATPQTITLGASLSLTNAAEPITIEGSTSVVITVSGNRQGGATIQDFLVGSGVTATFQNLTIADGNGGTNNGGGFAISGGNVTIDHCTITNNSAYSGGGIEIGSGTLLLENSTITGNVTPTTGYGAGAGLLIAGGSGVTVLSCLFTQNNSNGINGGTAGGIYAYNNTLPAVVVNSTFTGNIAAGYQQYGGSGGALGCNNGKINLIGCTLSGNAAQNGGSGGGIWCEYPSSQMNLTDDIIWNNTGSTPQDLSTGYNDAQTTVSYSILGVADSGNITTIGPGNVFNAATTPAILGSLADNGGPTQTMTPVTNSSEINAGGSVTTANAAVTSASASTLSVANGYAFAGSSITPALTFVNQPANTTAGAPMSAVTVQITRPVDFEEYIQVDSEIMEIVGLTINASTGAATLDVERGMDGTTATTHAANAPVYLVSDQRGEVVSQAMPVVDMGAVQSSAATPTAGLGLALKMAISSGNLDGSTTLLTNGSGMATFNNLSVPLTGTYQLVVGGLVSSNSFTVSTGTYPIVTGVSPGLGSSGGTVTITGTNFTGANAVNFGTTPATSFTVNSGTSITATIPAGTGIEDITVTNAVGTSGISSADRFSYASGVTGVSPNTGNAAGGAVVTITGTNFVDVTNVMFGSNAATSFTVDSATEITATAPAGGNIVNVTVISGGGTSAVSASDHFSYTSGTANWVVTNTLSTGAGSLFAAVQNAVATTITPSLITFDPTVFATAQTITLTSSLTFSNASQPITMQGPSNVAVTISGNQQGGGQIQDIIINSGTVTVQNLTIANGNAGANYGGAFSINAGTVTVNDCIISNSTAYDGGGFSISGGNLLLEDSTVSGNTTPSTGYGAGAGLVIQGGSATILSCLFTQNTSNGINGGTGGAIYEYAGGALTAIDSTFTGNTAASIGQYGGTGGAIASDSNGSDHGTVNLVGCTISGNTAQNGNGGGVDANYYYSVDLTNDIIWNNAATNSPDLALGSSSYGTPVINYTLVGNTSGSNIPSNGVGNILNVSTTTPTLGYLGNYGGPTQTMVPVADSFPVDAGGKVTTASAAISSTTITTISVANGSLFAAGVLPTLTSGSYYTIQIGSEQFAVIGANGSTLTVVRGVNGTAAATHASGAAIYIVSDQRGYVLPASNSAVLDMGACQSSASALLTTVTNISPASGPAGGGTSVIITGSNFTDASAVYFGANNATSFTVNSDTQITATSPAGAGVVDVTVVTAGGTSTIGNADHFTYLSPPTLSSVVVNGDLLNTTSTITAADETGNSVQITTAAAHGLYVGELVAINGVGTAGFNGTYSVTAVLDSTDFTYTDPTADLGNSNGGTAVNALAGSQRSMVDSITYQFSQAVTLSAGAISMEVNSGYTGTAGGLPGTISYNTIDDGHTWRVAFSGANVTGNSIADGVYDITLNAAHVNSDSGGGTLASSRTDTFYRLFGDSNGDSSVTSRPDVQAFAASFGTSFNSSAYLAYFDYNADGSITSRPDVQNFAARFGTSLTGFTATI